MESVVPGGPGGPGGLLAREADLETWPGLGRLELRDLEAADFDLGRVLGGAASLLITGDSA